MIARYKDKTLKHSTLRLIVATLATLLLLGGSMGCEDSKVVGAQNNQGDEKSNEQTPGEQPDDENAAHEGHGPEEEDDNHVEPGFMNGSWRVATGEQDEPAVYLDTFQDKGDSEVTGTYTMGFAIYDLYDGESGDLKSAEFSDNGLTVLWNPTTDIDEMLELTATRVDENTMTGTITAKRNPELNVEVTLTRQLAE